MGPFDDEIVESANESVQIVGQLSTFRFVELGHDRSHQVLPTFAGLSMAANSRLGGRDHHHAAIGSVGGALGESGAFEALHRAGRGRGIDAQGVGKVTHAPGLLLHEQIECVHLSALECAFTDAEDVIDERTHRCTSTEIAPGAADAHCDFPLCGVVEIEGRAGGRHGFCRVQAVEAPLHALEVLATQSVMITPSLRHLELFTLRGLVTVMWHEVPAGRPVRPAAIVACGGAMGGLLGPAQGLYQSLGDSWSARGIPVLRVSYRRPNDLDACCLDVAAAVQLASEAGAERVVVMGHSFGGAVAVRVAVAMDEVVGVVTFATQSAGCEVAAGLRGRPLLLFHGDRDEILPLDSSRIVAAMAGVGEVIVCEDDGHLLDRSGAMMNERLESWLPRVLGS